MASTPENRINSALTRLQLSYISQAKNGSLFVLNLKISLTTIGMVPKTSVKVTPTPKDLDGIFKALNF